MELLKHHAGATTELLGLAVGRRPGAVQYEVAERDASGIRGFETVGGSAGRCSAAAARADKDDGFPRVVVRGPRRGARECRRSSW